MPASVAFHLDGPIAANHRVSLRVLGNTLTSLQSAIDRAYLDTKYGTVQKHAHLKGPDYPLSEFIVGTPQEGGYVLEMLAAVVDWGNAVVHRMQSAVDSVLAQPWADGVNEAQKLTQQVLNRQAQLQAGVYPGRTIEEFRLAPDPHIVRAYGDRSIAKEFDQMLAPIRRRAEGELNGQNILQLKFEFDGQLQAGIYTFNRVDADRFHSVITERSLGEPLRYTGILRSLDRGTNFSRPKAKFRVDSTSRDVVLHIGSEQGYQELAPYMQGETTINIFACPIVEFGSFDSVAGDLYYVQMA